MSESIHLPAMGLWLGSVVMTGAAAGVLFPKMKGLAPTIPAYGAYTGEHWRIAAGTPAATLFDICDGIQLGCAMIAAVSLMTLVYVGKAPVRRPAMLVRIGALALAFVALGYQLFFLSPGMRTNLLAFWIAAKEGKNEAAEVFRAAFDAAHPKATAALAAVAACVLVSLITGAWSAATHDEAAARHGGRRATTPKTVIETPLLAKNPRL